MQCRCAAALAAHGLGSTMSQVGVPFPPRSIPPSTAPLHPVPCPVPWFGHPTNERVCSGTCRWLVCGDTCPRPRGPVSLGVMYAMVPHLVWQCPHPSQCRCAGRRSHMVRLVRSRDPKCAALVFQGWGGLHSVSFDRGNVDRKGRGGGTVGLCPGLPLLCPIPPWHAPRALQHWPSSTQPFHELCPLFLWSRNTWRAVCLQITLPPDNISTPEQHALEHNALLNTVPHSHNGRGSL